MKAYARKHSVDLDADFDYRHSIVLNGSVRMRQGNRVPDLFFWYGELHRQANSYDLSVLMQLAEACKVVRAPQVYERSLDKFSALSRLKAAGIPCADHVLFHERCLPMVEATMRGWEGVVLKPRRRGFGKGVTLITDYAQLRDIVQYIGDRPGASSEGIYLERFYPNDIRRWASVTVIRGEVMYGYRKRKSSFSRMGVRAMKVFDESETGGNAELCKLTETQEHIALAAARSLDMSIVGFDMIHTDSGPVIIDVNTFPGFYEDLFRKVGRDPVEEFSSVIIEEIEHLYD